MPIKDSIQQPQPSKKWLNSHPKQRLYTKNTYTLPSDWTGWSCYTLSTQIHGFDANPRGKAYHPITKSLFTNQPEHKITNKGWEISHCTLKQKQIWSQYCIYNINPISPQSICCTIGSKILYIYMDHPFILHTSSPGMNGRRMYV